MMLIYNLVLSTYPLFARIVGIWSPKARSWSEGRRDLFERMAKAIPSGEDIVWVHVASLGEFEQGRPIIEKIRKEHPQ